MVTNLVGTERRMNLALEVDSLDEVAERISFISRYAIAAGTSRKSENAAEAGRDRIVLPEDGAERRLPGSRARRKDFSLFDFPILQCWPQDGGRYITWPMVITKNPETGKRNVGCYRMQVFDERTTGMHWQTQKHGAEHFRSARAKNKGREAGSCRRDRRRSGHVPCGNSAGAAGYGRISFLRLSAARPGGTGALQDGRS